MSMSIPFDTLDYAKKLEATGMPLAQAEQQSKVLADVLGRSVAFPNDLVTLEKNLTAKVEAVELRLVAKMASSESSLETKISSLAGDVNLVKWMMGTLIGFNIAIFLKLFL